MKPDNWLHKEWRPSRLKAYRDLVAAEREGPTVVRDAFNQLKPEHRQWGLGVLAANRVPLLCATAFSVPVLSREACRYIIERSNSYQWEENREEGEAFRIPEAVLSDVDPELCRDVLDALMQGLAPWFVMIWNKLPTNLKSIQLARYNPDDRSGGNWHVDRDSNFTAVISLDPQAFEGGGTYLADGCFGEREVEPLPQGWALVFDGRRTLHEGLPVTSGDRRLLVVWANDVEEDKPAALPVEAWGAI